MLFLNLLWLFYQIYFLYWSNFLTIFEIWTFYNYDLTTVIFFLSSWTLLLSYVNCWIFCQNTCKGHGPWSLYTITITGFTVFWVSFEQHVLRLLWFFCIEVGTIFVSLWVFMFSLTVFAKHCIRLQTLSNIDKCNLLGSVPFNLFLFVYTYTHTCTYTHMHILYTYIQLFSQTFSENLCRVIKHSPVKVSHLFLSQISILS